MKPNEERRYSTARWGKTRAAVLIRDMRRCWVVNCPEYANIADHINPVYYGMPDHEFFSMSNLRASCSRHNWARGVSARLEREMRDGVNGTEVPASTRNPFIKRGRFLGSRNALDMPLFRSLSPSANKPRQPPRNVRKPA